MARRLFSVLGSSRRQVRPWVGRTSERCTRSSARSKSRSGHLSPNASPRRKPVVASTAHSAPSASSRVPSRSAFTWVAANTECSRRVCAGTIRLPNGRVHRDEPVIDRRTERDPEHRTRLFPRGRREPPRLHLGEHVADLLGRELVEAIAAERRAPVARALARSGPRFPSSPGAARSSVVAPPSPTRGRIDRRSEAGHPSSEDTARYQGTIDRVTWPARTSRPRRTGTETRTGATYGARVRRLHHRSFR